MHDSHDGTGGVSHSEVAWAVSGNATEVKVAGVTLANTGETYYKISEDGSSTIVNDESYNVMYDSSKNTLTLKNFKYTGTQNGIYAKGALTIILQGTNEIKAEGTNKDLEKNAYGIWTTGNLTISGTSQTEGKLKVTSKNSDAIFAFDDYGAGTDGYNESLIISNADIEALSEKSVGIGASNEVTITNSHVVSTGGMHGIQGGYFKES